jgi:sialidase-1
MKSDQLLLALFMSEIGLLDKVGFETDVPQITRPFTITFWFFAAGPRETQVIANQGATAPSEAGWSIRLEANEVRLRWQPPGHEGISLAAPLADFSRWHHVAAVAGERLTLYLDGVPAGSAPLPDAPLFAGDQPLLRLGGYTDPAGGHFDHSFGRAGSGMLDAFRLYRRALTAADIAAFIPEAGPAPAAHFQIEQVDSASGARYRFVAAQDEAGAGADCVYLWRFGDGVTAIGPSASHEYAYSGQYQVALSVLDRDHRMGQTVKSLAVEDNYQTQPPQPVFVNGKEGHNCYRIPSIVRAANGDLLAFAEGRVAHCSDSTEAIRLVMKRSRDNGMRWDPLQVVARHFVNGTEYAIQNISPVVDMVYGTGRVLLVYNLTEHNEWDVARGIGVNRVAMRVSDDHGATWSQEQDITLKVHRPYNPSYLDVYSDAAPSFNQAADWRNQRPTLGHAIQLERSEATRGMFLFVGSFTRAGDSVFEAYNYVFWSHDLGRTWKIGGIIDGERVDGSSAQGLNEATAVELPSGDVMINSRNYQGGQPVGVRAVSIASFNNSARVSFSPTRHDETLIESPVQASTLRLTFGDEPDAGGKSRLLFCNAAHPQARYELTLRLSYDEGETWPVARVVDPGPSAYCDLVLQADGQIGVLYERGNQGGIYYASRTLSWLTDSEL